MNCGNDVIGLVGYSESTYKIAFLGLGLVGPYREYANDDAPE